MWYKFLLGEFVFLLSEDAYLAFGNTMYGTIFFRRFCNKV